LIERRGCDEAEHQAACMRFDVAFLLANYFSGHAAEETPSLKIDAWISENLLKR
jgi:hypothetical protein